MRRSRSLSTERASPSALRRVSDSSLSASRAVGRGGASPAPLAAFPLSPAPREPRLLVGDLVDQPVLPFLGITFLADWSIERHVTAETAVHVDHVLLGHAAA